MHKRRLHDGNAKNGYTVGQAYHLTTVAQHLEPRGLDAPFCPAD
jgi:hypothetical protein